MTRWLPFPLAAAALLAMWLLLNESAGAGAVLLGAVLALAAARTMTTLDVPTAGFRRPLAALKLAFLVLVEIVRSNEAVARIILGRRTERTSSAGRTFSASSSVIQPSMAACSARTPDPGARCRYSSRR